MCKLGIIYMCNLPKLSVVIDIMNLHIPEILVYSSKAIQASIGTQIQAIKTILDIRLVMMRILLCYIFMLCFYE